jgi:hypothetical protein
MAIRGGTAHGEDGRAFLDQCLASAVVIEMAAPPGWRLRATIAAHLPLIWCLDRISLDRRLSSGRPDESVDDAALAEWVDQMLKRLPPPWKHLSAPLARPSLSLLPGLAAPPDCASVFGEIPTRPSPRMPGWSLVSGHISRQAGSGDSIRSSPFPRCRTGRRERRPHSRPSRYASAGRR